MNVEKGGGVIIGQDDGAPLRSGPHEYWDPIFANALRDDLGRFLPKARVERNGVGFRVEFSVTEEKNGENVLGDTLGLGGESGVRVPTAEFNAFSAALEALHQRAGNPETPSFLKAFYRDFKVPNPTVMPQAWRIASGKRRRLFILWGYEAGGADSVVLPLTVVSRKWEDAEARVDLGERLRSCSLLGGPVLNPRWVMSRIVAPLVAVAAVAVLLFAYFKPVYCDIHPGIRFVRGACPSVCQSCGRHLDASGKCRDVCAVHPECHLVDGACPKTCREPSCGRHLDAAGRCAAVCEKHADAHLVNGVCLVCHPNCDIHVSTPLDASGNCTNVCVVCGRHLDAVMHCEDICPKCGRHKSFGDICQGDCPVCQRHRGAFQNSCPGFCDEHRDQHLTLSGDAVFCTLCVMGAEHKVKECLGQMTRRRDGLLEDAGRMEKTQADAEKCAEDISAILKKLNGANWSNEVAVAVEMAKKAAEAADAIAEKAKSVQGYRDRGKMLEELSRLEDERGKAEANNVKADGLLSNLEKKLPDAQRFKETLARDCEMLVSCVGMASNSIGNVEEVMAEMQANVSRMETALKTPGLTEGCFENLEVATNAFAEADHAAFSIRVAFGKVSEACACRTNALTFFGSADVDALRKAVAEGRSVLGKAQNSVEYAKELIMRARVHLPHFSVATGVEDGNRLFIVSYGNDVVDGGGKCSWMVSVRGRTEVGGEKSRHSKPVSVSIRKLGGRDSRAISILEENIRSSARKARLTGDIPLDVSVEIGKVKESAELILGEKGLELL